MRKALVMMLASGLLLGAIASAPAAKKPKPKPTLAFEDVAGDAGSTSQGVPVPGAEQAGLDLVSGHIETVGKNIRFTVTTAAAMPDFGFMPETVRLLWHVTSGGKQFQFTVKSFDVGKPDIVAGGVGQERIGQVYTAGVVRLEACGEEALPAVLTLVQCETSVYTEPVIDVAAKTISWEVPMKELSAKKGSTIAAGTFGHAAQNCPVCFIPHYAERSLSPHTTIDAAALTGVHKV